LSKTGSFFGRIGAVEVALEDTSVPHRDVDIFLDDDLGSHRAGISCDETLVARMRAWLQARRAGSEGICLTTEFSAKM